ncbi:hypothetical protein CMQ_866 [Grosmannia clavigera kw1407]|uniref:F-box domain containing protein n=1 Tax=Grosmannia clavigera (strain kw1407 / UAMH 11150) TaxID=655863 RepID=F0XC22_GROCL|nr:uncharacterized protein CMQ_866 [Grosmannia clavigera kw1407]EFX03938.1 hypothetical protein CMQ_866 [Grosmannia clavigera kw1407]
MESIVVFSLWTVHVCHNLVVRLWRAWHPSRQSPTCVLERLPAELIIDMDDYFSSQSRILLSRTCRSLRAMLTNTDDFYTVGCSSRAERAEFLYLVARDIPDRWLCDACMALHEVTVSDTPPCKNTRHCKLYKDSYDYARKPALAPVNYRHVQLALKYSRMKDGISRYHRHHLAKLLEPFSYTKTVCLRAYSSIFWARCESYPKVAMAPDGGQHYLLLTIVSLRRPRNLEDALGRTGSVNICPHQRTDSRDKKEIEDFKNEYHDNDRGPISDGTWQPDIDLALYDMLQMARGRGRSNGSRSSSSGHRKSRTRSGCYDEVCGSCLLCTTDYSFRLMPQSIELRVWQDLGPEGAPSNSQWQMHISEKYFYHENDRGDAYDEWSSIAAVHRVDGSVRQLYESDMSDRGA